MDINLSIGSAFIGGLFSFFSPCILPLLPVYFGILSETDPNEKISGRIPPALWRALNTVCFVLGVGVSFAVLGFGFGTVSVFVSKTWVRLTAGALVIVMGLSQMGLFAIPLFARFGDHSEKVTVRSGPLRSFLLGLLVSIGWIPCIGAILASILFLSGSSGSAAAGGGLMLVYVLGLALPFLVITLFSGFFLKKLRKIHPYLPLIKKIGGALLVVMGILLMMNRFG